MRSIALYYLETFIKDHTETQRLRSEGDLGGEAAERGSVLAWLGAHDSYKIKGRLTLREARATQ
jgi:hypothetical protein